MTPPASVPPGRAEPPVTRSATDATDVAADRRRLPQWRSVLAVVAHPDDESFGLGAVLAAFAAAGAGVSVLCFTHGEASTLHGVPGSLAEVRAKELREAADALGVSAVELLDHPDGRLPEVPVSDLAAQVTAAATRADATGLLVFDPSGVTGHPDHRRATEAALGAAIVLGLPVLGWTLPAEVAATLNAEHLTSFVGHPHSGIDLTIAVDRARQYEATRCHPSQAVPLSPLWRRLELLGDTEHLRWLHSTGNDDAGVDDAGNDDAAADDAPAAGRRVP